MKRLNDSVGSRTFLLATLVAICTLSMPAPGLAEGYIEEVVVTARKREENLLDTPVSVSAFTASDLARYQVDDLGDIQNIVPNLSLNVGDAANAIVYIRGIGQRDSLSFADPGVGVYMDDVYLGRAQGSFLDVIDVSRIEVLRGPQGTLYGRNSIGGAIKYVSAAPTLEPLFEVQAGFGDYHQKQVRGTWSGPLNSANNLLARVTLAHHSHDGYNDNVAANANSAIDGDKDATAARLQLQFDPRDDLTIKFSADYSDDDPERSTTPVRVTSGPALSSTTANLQPSASPHDIEADFNDLERLTVQGLALTAEYDISDAWLLKSITAHRQLTHEAHIDLDGTGFDVFGVFVDQEQDQFSQELQLAFDAGGSISALLGLYYFDETDVTPDGISNSEPLNFGAFNSTYTTVSENDQQVKAKAIFGEVSWLLSDALTLTLGGRYSHEKKRLQRRACQNFGIFGTQLPPIHQCNPPLNSLNPLALNVDLSKSFSKFTPKLALNYQNDDLGLVYFSYSQGFKSGGFDGRIGYNGAQDGGAVTAQAQAYEPEIADTYELGWKSRLAENRIRLSTAFFFNDYQDLQLSSFSATPEGGFATVFTNAGRAESWGFEGELLAYVTDHILVNMSLGYLDAQYKEYIDATTRQNISHLRTPINAPDLTASAGVQYTVPLAGYQLVFAADASYRSDYFVDVNNLQALQQDPFTLVNASVRLESNDERWDVTVGAKNISDTTYITHGFDLTAFPGVGLAYYGEPRTYRVQARYRF